MRILDKIIEVAKKYPERLVVVEKDNQYTYLDLLVAMHLLAGQILTDSKRPILVFGSNDFRMLAAMLASNLTGHAYIPIDAHTPIERTKMIFEAAKPSLVISTVDLSDELAQLFGYYLSFVKFDRSPEFDRHQIDSSHSVAGSELAYIIYTSGTTGLPKGVAVSHDNLATFTDWMNRDFEQIEANQFLEQPPYSFDLSIFSLYPCLTSGGTLQALGRDETTNFKLLFERLNRIKLNTWISTPSFVDICLLDPSFTENGHPDLKQFIFCGEELMHRTAEKLLAAFPNSAVYNTYGPTEATGAVSSVKITPEILEKYTRLPIGRAKPGVELKVIDDEIIIAGNSVAAGYFENPQKTAEAFFELNQSAAYHTGDTGFIDETGNLNYKGRLDFQVKFNGFRIELQDIEANLLALAEVEKALVLPKVSEQHKTIGLVAVLVVKNPQPDREYTKALKAELAKTIMDYMMPTKFVYVADFPLNQNGKIDRKALTAEVLGQ